MRGINLNDYKFGGINFYEADLREADLTEGNFYNAVFTNADLSRATLTYAFLVDAYFTGANLNSAELDYVDLDGADIDHANLNSASLVGANLNGANLNGSDLSGANLSKAILVETDFTDANLSNCVVYGISAWSLQLERAAQVNLIITDWDEPIITVDNLNIAQFIYLLLNNAEIRDVIDTVAKKAVLILGRFTPERKTILDAIREALRVHDYLPILFDFDKPASRDITETVSTLAHLSRFVIADITDAKSIPQELMVIVPNLPSVPVQPLILQSQREYGMFEHFTRYPWVLPVYHYTDEEGLLQSLNEKVIAPAEQKAKELERH